MKRILTKLALALIAVSAPATATSQAHEGHWANPQRTVIVNDIRCGDAPRNRPHSNLVREPLPRKRRQKL